MQVMLAWCNCAGDAGQTKTCRLCRSISTTCTFLLPLSIKWNIEMGMNKLPLAKRVQVLKLLTEGMSMRAISRTTDVSFNTIVKMLEDAGKVSAEMHDEMVRGVKSPAFSATKSGRSIIASSESLLRPRPRQPTQATFGLGPASTPTASLSSLTSLATVPAKPLSS
jgi:molybdenum-dependent DNA-binding transcriptional regulator ModE